MGNLVLGLNNIEEIYLNTPQGKIILQFWFDKDKNTEVIRINAPNNVRITHKKDRNKQSNKLIS